jgi:hypothetical protein
VAAIIALAAVLAGCGAAGRAEDATAPAGSQTLWVVGDGMDGPASKALVSMMSTRFDAADDVFVYLGDVYSTGTGAEMTRWWNTWMRGKPWMGRALSVLGNHEYGNRGARGGYYSRWADSRLRFLGADIVRMPRGDPERFHPRVPSARHWSWTMGGWQPTTFSTPSPVREERAFGANVRAARHAGTCHIPIGHHGPHAASDGSHESETENARWRPLWNDYRGKAKIWIDAHSHTYHRAIVSAPAGAPAVMRFTVGTGGYSFRRALSPQPRPLPSGRARERAVVNATAAVLALELTRGRAAWRLIDHNGNVRDSGSLRCAPGA